MSFFPFLFPDGVRAMLWVKILAGLTAALAVVGVGVYVALPAGHCCHGKSDESPKSSCCSASSETCPISDASSECPVEAATPSCCAFKSTPNADALAACTGGMAVSPAPQATTKLKFACCGE